MCDVIEIHEGVPDIIFYILINSPTDGSYKVIIVLSTILSATVEIAPPTQRKDPYMSRR